MQLAQQLEPKLVLGVAPRVEHEPAARDARDERRDGEERASRRRASTPSPDRPEDGVDGRLRLPVDAVHRQLKRRQRQRPDDVLRPVAARALDDTHANAKLDARMHLGLGRTMGLGSLTCASPLGLHSIAG
jgi:hypothetical protein